MNFECRPGTPARYLHTPNLDGGYPIPKGGPTAFLHAVLAHHSPALAERLRLHDNVSRRDAGQIVSALGDEVASNLDDEWEPTEYGRAASTVLARFNAHRIGEWP